MNRYQFIVTVVCETEEQAHQVAAERLCHDEQYELDGAQYDYEIGYEPVPWRDGLFRKYWSGYTEAEVRRVKS